MEENLNTLKKMNWCLSLSDFRRYVNTQMNEMKAV